MLLLCLYIGAPEAERITSTLMAAHGLSCTELSMMTSRSVSGIVMLPMTADASMSRKMLLACQSSCQRITMRQRRCRP